jgi:hypothetical protein
MNIRFYVDPETDLPHTHEHQVDEQKVKQVLRQPREDRPGREGVLAWRLDKRRQAGISELFMCRIQNPIPSLLLRRMSWLGNR